MQKRGIVFVLLIALWDAGVNGQLLKRDSISSSLTIKGDWFMAYQWIDPNQDNNAFKLKRGYLTVENKFNDIFSARYTQDITIDDEGDDAGNVELRFKYCYLKAMLPDAAFFTHSYIVAGLVHRPWMDFEEHVNGYRVQGEMFLDRHKVIGSADFGLTYVTLLGGKLDKDYQEKVSRSYPGKYGSIAVGVYNGAGYHALENNNNKTVEGRFSLRPFPEKLPGLQLSYNMAFGKSNDSLSSDFRVNALYLSYESRWVTLSAQYYTGKGNMSGSVTGLNEGYSLFGELVIPNTNLMVFSRYDYFDPHALTSYEVAIAGVGYRFYRQNRILFDIDWNNRNGIKRVYEVALEIKF